ncbi:hypothetical protein [Sulfurimonas sp.]|uniref:hypothetical protein n=1 Tax=Sulfurimonas sp. TaxID=2022749 RepID=UPI00356441FD
MIDILKKELIIYTALLTLLIFLMHPDMLSDPIVRLGLMQDKANYIHPLLYTFFVYLILFFLRAVSGFIAKLFEKK